MQTSDEQVFKSVYDAYQRPIFSFAFYLTKSADVSEEIVQEVFVRLWEKRQQLQADTYILAYLKKITQNLVYDFFRKAHRDHSLQEHIYQHVVEQERQSPDVLLEKQLNMAYQRALDKLPPQQRIIFTLSRDEQLTYQQIADQLQLSRNTVRNHMAEAIKSVRQYIQRDSDLACFFLLVMLPDQWK